MKITKILAVSVMLLIGAFAANAQPGGQGGFGQMNPEQMVKMRADRLKESLKLTDDQYNKVLALYKKDNEEMMKMMQGGGMPDMEAFQKRREAQNAELKKILTEAQYKQYEEQNQQMMRGMGGPGGPGGQGRPQGAPGQGRPRQ